MILQFLSAIPGTNAPVERVFSLMNSYWSDEKSRLSEDTLEAGYESESEYGRDLCGIL